MKSDLQIKPPDVAANLPARSGSGAACAVAYLVAMLSSAGAAPLKPSPEDRYVTTRDAAIEKFSPKYDAGNFDDTAKQAEEAAFADLKAQMSAIMAEPDRKGFGPAKLNIETFYKRRRIWHGRWPALRRRDRETGEKAGSKTADGKYVEPKAHIVVTTQSMFARWLRVHNDWWDKKCRNVSQQIGSALKDESFYIRCDLERQCARLIDQRLQDFPGLVHWQKQTGRATLPAPQGIEECLPSRYVTLSGRTAWVPRNDPGRSIGGLF